MATIIKRGKKPRKHFWSNRYYICNYCTTIYFLEGDEVIIEASDEQFDGIMVHAECSVCEEPRWLMHKWIGKEQALRELGVKKEE